MISLPERNKPNSLASFSIDEDDEDGKDKGKKSAEEANDDLDLDLSDIEEISMDELVDDDNNDIIEIVEATEGEDELQIEHGAAIEGEGEGDDIIDDDDIIVVSDDEDDLNDEHQFESRRFRRMPIVKENRILKERVRSLLQKNLDYRRASEKLEEYRQAYIVQNKALKETNLFIEKLGHAYKLLENQFAGSSRTLKEKIIERIDAASSAKEVKTIYEAYVTMATERKRRSGKDRKTRSAIRESNVVARPAGVVLTEQEKKFINDQRKVAGLKPMYD